MSDFVSIDQNSHPLWDTVPKLDALIAKGLRGTHYLEDVDVAFTRRGAEAEGGQLEIMPERYYRGGASDWGATLFYTEFLGRNPLDVTSLESYTGMTTKALSRLLQTTVDGLYDWHSRSDNWQMVGPSYVDGNRERHRVIGDLTIAETLPHIQQLLAIAERDMTRSFPESAPRQRLEAWFAAERQAMDRLTGNRSPEEPLVELYRDWMTRHVPDAAYALTSERFAIGNPDNANGPLVHLFLNQYEKAGEIYNQAIASTGVGLNKLATKSGELPFFLVWRRGGGLCRTSAALDGRTLVAADHGWRLHETARGWQLPAGQMMADGVCAVAGKALLLVLQARMGEDGRALALPYRGSSYMPAAYAFERELCAENLISEPIHPIYRVKINFLDSLRESSVMIRLPDHLAGAFGREELPACTFAEQLPDIVDMAQTALWRATSDTGRRQLLEELTPSLEAAANELEQTRRTLAANPETRDKASALWDDLKALRQRQWETFVDFIVARLHVADLDYFNSRGAILPWSIALGGMEHYRRLIATAEVYEEKQT